MQLRGEDLLDRSGDLVSSGPSSTTPAAWITARDRAEPGLGIGDGARACPRGCRHRRRRPAPRRPAPPAAAGQGCGGTAGRRGRARPDAPAQSARGRAGAAGDQHDLRAVAADQVFGQRQADAAEAAGDQHRRALRQSRASACGQRGRLARPAPAAGRRAGRRWRCRALASRSSSTCVASGPAARSCRGACRTAAAPRRARNRSTPGQFARDHPDRAEDGGLFRVGQRLAAHLRRAGGDDGQVDRAGQAFLGHRLGQEQQAVEALFQVAVEEAGAGAEAFAAPSPARNARCGSGGVPLRHQIADQRVIAFAAAFGGEHIAVLARRGRRRRRRAP